MKPEQIKVGRRYKHSVYGWVYKVLHIYFDYKYAKIMVEGLETIGEAQFNWLCEDFEPCDELANLEDLIMEVEKNSLGI